MEGRGYARPCPGFEPADGHGTGDGRFTATATLPLRAAGVSDTAQLYELDLEPAAGLSHYLIHAYPHHPARVHRFEPGAMGWI